MSQAEFIIGRFDWAKNRGGGGGRDTFHLRGGRTGRAMGNVRGLPQVMFKVVRNGGCVGSKGLSAQLDYVLGKAEHIIDPNKEYDRLDHLPAEFSEAMAKDWAEGWDRRVKSGHSMHMVASFPMGTDAEKVADIMRDTCHDIFDQGRSRFNYIAALHTDNGLPHVHIVVDRKNAEGEWFYFARDGEFTYDRVKDTIVAHAAAHGIEMVNSSRLSRGLTGDAADDRDRAKNPALRGLSGTLMDHGAAPYQNNPKERMSYFVTVKSPQGVKTLWGKELGPVMAESGAEQGDAIRVTHEGKEAVQVKTRDGRTIETHRNQWAVELPERGISTGQTSSSEPSAGEQRSAEWKRDQVKAHAAEYRSLSAAFADGFSALSRGFSAAADLLERGLSLTPETLQQVRRITMPEAVQHDPAAREATIQQGVAAEIADYKRMGYDNAAIGGSMLEIEDRVEARVSVAESRGEELGSWERLKAADAVEDLLSGSGFEKGAGVQALDQQRESASAESRDAIDARIAAVLAESGDEIRAEHDAEISHLTARVQQLEADGQDAEAGTVRSQLTEAQAERAAFDQIEEKYSAMAEQPRQIDMPAEAELQAESAQVLTVIEEARGKLAEVREAIPDLEPEDRPQVEAQYFAAVRDVERLTTGIDRAEYSDPAQGTIYADGHREAIAGMDRADLATTLEGTGLDAAEVAARVNVEARSAALEAHWVAVDAQTIADTRGYDMETEEGSRQAYEELAATYKAVSERSFSVERLEPTIADDRDLVAAVEEREALIEEARDLASRDHLSAEQQERLTEIVEQVAGKDAVHELRGGESDALSEIFPDKAERFDVAEKYLEAEQSKGADRGDAIEAVQNDRAIMEIEQRHERQAGLEQEAERETEARRERNREDGHEL